MTDPDKFKIGLIQMAMCGDGTQNLSHAIERIQQAAVAGAEIICLPELFRSPYFCQREDPALFDLAEPIPGPTTQALSKIASKTKTTLIAPIFEKRAPGIYHNSSAILGPDGNVLGVYRKMHIPDDPAYYEKYYFTPGDLGFRTFDTPMGKVAVLICWDQWFPEGARLAALRGGRVIFYPTAIGWHPAEKDQSGKEQREAWQTIQRAHAIANGVYVAAVNRTGHERPSADAAGIEFWGSSFVCDPLGVPVAQAPVDAEENLIVEIDPRRIEDVRRNWPFLRDRRIDAYGDISKRYQGDEGPVQ
ncbi:MAG: carbon-nitrogen hydrolase [Terriglobia bacterium]